MHKVNRALISIENGIAGLSLVAAVGLAVLSIILRAGFGTIIFWAEEAIIYLIIASTFFGAIITLRDNEHVNVDILPSMMQRGGKKVMALIAGVVTVAYLGIIAVLGWLLLAEPFSFDTVTPALKLPLGAVETIVPVAFTLMFIRAVLMFWDTWKHGVQELTAADVARLEGEAAGVSAADIASAQRETLATLEEQHQRFGEPGHHDPGLERRGTRDRDRKVDHDRPGPDAGGDDRRGENGGPR